MTRLVALDTETYLIQPGLLVPPLVCVSMAMGEGKNVLLDKEDGCDVVEKLLADRDVTLVLHNAPFDMAVFAAHRPSLLPAIFQAYADGRVRDTQVRQELLDIARGRRQDNGQTFVLRGDTWGKANYSLAGLVGHYLQKDRTAEKTTPDAWRMRYHELDGLPLAEWPDAAVAYALDDASDTREVFLRQGGLEGALPTEVVQNQAAWALHLMATWGMRTDRKAVTELEAKLLAEQDAVRGKLKKAGILVARRATSDETPDFHEVRLKHKKLTKKEVANYAPEQVEYRDAVPYLVTEVSTPMRWAKDTKRLEAYVERVYKRKGKLASRTDSGRIATNKDTLYQSGSRLLELVADGGGVDKILGTYVPMLKTGTETPINARFRVLVNSGRTSCAEPNLQNLPSGRRVGGVRECFVPRPGFVFVSVDYDTLELRALAQACLTLFGESTMARAINDGRDLHSAVGAEMLGLTYQQVELGKKEKGSKEKKARDAAKAFNFGAPGGLGAASLVEFARATYGITLTEEQAREMKAQWLKAWPEMKRYFAWINEQVGLGDAVLTHPNTGFVRGGVGYTDGCNHLFQHLAATGAKMALFHVAWESYVQRNTALFGTRPVAFIHDEIVAEVPEDRAHEASMRLAQVMVEQMARVIPDVKIGASPALMWRWYKEATEVFVDGRLVPWTPKVA